MHQFLHDRFHLYRFWHHSAFRLPTHLVIAGLTLAAAATVILVPQLSQNPAAATGILAQFPFQGRLTNADGTVVTDGSYDVVFQLYTQDSGGFPVWTENHTGGDQISTTDGIFSTMLGNITSLTGIDFNQDEYWLGVTVGADAEMTPRIRLGAAPYAFNADKLDGVSAEGFLQLSGQSGGQTAYGGTAANEQLVLRSTSHAIKGYVIIADDDSRVTIGDANPATPIAKLTVTSTSDIRTVSVRGVSGQTDDLQTWARNVAPSVYTDVARLGIGGTLVLADDASGSNSIQIGPGPTYADARLNIKQNLTGGANIFLQGSSGLGGTATTSNIYFGDGEQAGAAISSNPYDTGSTLGNDIVFKTTDDVTSTALTSRMVIDQLGRIGVGSLSDPFQTILGSTALSATARGIHVDTGSDGANILMEGDDPRIGFVNSTGGVNGRWSQILQSSDDFLGFFSRNDDGTLIQTTTTPSLSISNTNGNIGVGTSDPFLSILGSVATGGKGIHIDAGSGFAQLALEGDDPVMDFVNISGGSNDKWTRILQSSAGQLRFYGMTDAGALLHGINSPALVIDDSSNYIGISTPSPTTKLEVFNAAATSGSDWENRLITANQGISTANSIYTGYDMMDGSIRSAAMGYGFDGTGYFMSLGTNDNTTGDPIERLRLDRVGDITFGGNMTASTGDFYDTSIPAAVSSTNLCISGGGQIGTCSSDARLKRNINAIGSGLSVIEQLSPKTYDYVSGQTGQSGFIAQDVQQVLPGLVTKNTGDDYLSLNYDGIVAYAVQAIQELDQQIKVLDASKAGKADRLSLTALTTRSLVVSSGARIDGSLAVAGSTEFAGTLSVKDTATFEKDVAVGGNLAVSGSILGSSQTRGIDVPVEETATVLEVFGLDLPEESTYAVSVTPSWRTGFWVTDKTNESFTIHFDVPAPKDATADYLIQR